MTVFKKTILGKILGGAAKVVLPVVGAVTGIGAISGIIKGTGAIAGIVTAGKAVIKTVDTVATGAANLVSGITAEQRKMIQEEKAETKVDTQNLTTIERLIKAGASVEEAASKVGVPLSALKGLFGVPSDEQVKTEIQEGSPQLEKTTVTPTTGGCAGIFILLIAAGSLLSYFVGSLIF